MVVGAEDAMVAEVGDRKSRLIKRSGRHIGLTGTIQLPEECSLLAKSFAVSDSSRKLGRGSLVQWGLTSSPLQSF